MIKRRSLLKTGAAAAIAAPAITGFAQQTVTLKFHTFMAPQSNVWLNMHKAWMNKVEKESGGRIKFEVPMLWTAHASIRPGMPPETDQRRNQVHRCHGAGRLPEPRLPDVSADSER